VIQQQNILAALFRVRISATRFSSNFGQLAHLIQPRSKSFDQKWRELE
jgi:hypothetical protein